MHTIRFLLIFGLISVIFADELEVIVFDYQQEKPKTSLKFERHFIPQQNNHFELEAEESESLFSFPDLFEQEYSDLQDDTTTYPMPSLNELATIADTLAEQYSILMAKRFHLPQSPSPFSFHIGPLTGSVTLKSSSFIDAHIQLRYQDETNDLYIDQERRMKPNQINYIDHNNIGVFMLYTPIKEEKNNG